MDRQARIELIQQIQELRDSNVLVYFTGDRQPMGSRIAEDAVRPLYKHLLGLMETAPARTKIDLFPTVAASGKRNRFEVYIK